MRIFLIGILLAASNCASAQGFGVNEGDPISKYKGVRYGESGGRYKITVPLPNAEFEEYIATATPETGICAVSGIGKTHGSDSYGGAVRSAFKDIQNVLKNKYGKSEDFDFLQRGSIWHEARDFAMSLHKKERSLASFWGEKSGSRNLGKIEGIMLSAKALSSEKTFLTLQYEFRNIDACDAVIKKQDNAGL